MGESWLLFFTQWLARMTTLRGIASFVSVLVVSVVRAPRRAGKRRSLASAVNKQLSEEADAPTVPTETCSRKGMPLVKIPYATLLLGSHQSWRRGFQRSCQVGEFR